jgi:hypothetical protein
MNFESLLDQAEQNPDSGPLIASLLIQSAQVNLNMLPEAQQERLYNLLAYVFANGANGPHNALQAALQRVLTQPPVLEYFQRRMEASGNYLEMLENNPAAPVILALLCSHDEPEIAERAAIALAYTGSQMAYEMLQRWLTDSTNRRLQRAAQVALPYFEAQSND